MKAEKALIAGFLLLAAPAAHAAGLLPSVSAGVTLDERRRGLSWSGGDVSTNASVGLSFSDLRVGAGVTALRGSPRHDGSDALFDFDVSYIGKFGLFHAGPTFAAHVFTGHGAMNYVEVGGLAGASFGPASLDLVLNYAPSQSAIGGDNLYVGGQIEVGIPVTPFTVSASLGHTSGGTNDPWLAARLRPTGSYTNYRFGIDYVMGPIRLGAAYSGTNVDQDRVVLSPYADLPNSGGRFLVSAGLSF